ncbi:MAG: glycosyltransferase [Chlorobiales bacterium]|nr:glycosyltransferase [Chlorobiales bacterium]
MNFLFLNSARRGWGGNEKSVKLVAEALSQEHTVIVGFRAPHIGARFKTHTRKLPFLFELDLYTIASLVRIVRKHRIEIIISSKRKDYAIGGIVARICRIKNIIWLGANRKLKNTCFNNLIYKKLADGIIVNARQIRNTLFESPFVQEQNIRVIYNGIDTESLKKALREHRQKVSTVRDFTITAMGRIDRNKGFDFLIRSFARFVSANGGIKAKLVIIGNGPFKKQYELLAKKLGIDSVVRFTGFLDDPFLELCTSEVYASTSMSEGLSIALLEAMYLYNVPVSTYAGGGVKEIIENGVNGFLFNYGDEEALADIFLKLYRDAHLCQNLVVQAHTSVADRYRMQKVLDEIIDFCRITRKSQ